ncbi:hypothetical protein [Actinokineospora sp. NBRC 105648]|uniref:hypothetical protein n=1 Tax=Actinokineospora sp. NBRC 105648 TaxID=3032206 RepID=UPI0024A29628|nr:hypothetical protein [Actinokineospora sp. NBRC 105648]GLZ40930.1 hypothetical protein Acsp05_45540 [Actinokineospora sp. NBRC 105648]
MSSLPERLSGALSKYGYQDELGYRPVPARVVRAVNYGVAVEHGRAIVQAARARAVEHVAEEAMQAAGRLSQSEAFWMRHAPQGAGRFQAIADLAAMALADIVSEAGRD